MRMTPEQSAAYVNAQAALLNAEIEMMVAANKFQENIGRPMMYGEGSFARVLERFTATLNHDAVYKLFIETDH